MTRVHSRPFPGAAWHNPALCMQVTGGEHYKYGTSKCHLHSHFKQTCPSPLFLLCRKDNNQLNFLPEPYFSILITDPTRAPNTLSLKACLNKDSTLCCRDPARLVRNGQGAQWLLARDRDTKTGTGTPGLGQGHWDRDADQTRMLGQGRELPCRNCC